MSIEREERDWLKERTGRLICEVEEQCARLRRSIGLSDPPAPPPPTVLPDDAALRAAGLACLVESQGARHRTLRERCRSVRAEAEKLRQKSVERRSHAAGQLQDI